MDKGGVAVAGSRAPARRRSSRRRRLLTHSGPVAVLALAAFAVGAAVGSGPGRDERHLAGRYVTLWTRGELARMYPLLDAESRARVSARAFAAEIEAAARTATVRSLRMLGSPQITSAGASVAMAVSTRLWGTLHETLVLPLTGSGSRALIHLQSFDSVPRPASRRVAHAPHRAAAAGDAALLDRRPARRGRGPHQPRPGRRR